MSDALAILGYIVMGAAGLSLLAVIVGLPFAVLASMRQVARDDAVADLASGMDDFSAPEGGTPR